MGKCGGLGEGTGVTATRDGVSLWGDGNLKSAVVVA